MKRPLVWLNLVNGGIFGIVTAMRFGFGDEPLWMAWFTLMAAVSFTATGLGYLYRFRKQQGSPAAPPEQSE
ncbi:hypothetical protein DSY14_13930 [Nocardiopsis sp. MG754419]|nr:hypothetical protein [Nocardiopsis sp. MG754419]